jgi:hypothetical protein
MRIKQPPVSHECIDGEVVIINMETGTYYSLIGMSSSLWQMIAAGCTRSAWTQRLGDRYGEMALQPAQAFLDELVREGLVSMEEALSLCPTFDLPVLFEAPRIEKFTDLQEMLILDAIHEVDAAAGWPYRAD